MNVPVAWFFLRFFDEPVRAWLTHRHGIKQTTSNVASK